MAHLLRRFRSALRLPWAETARAAEAAALFHGFRLVLRVVPVRRLRWVLGTASPPETSPAVEGRAAPAPALAVAQALYRATRPYPDTCLPQTLAARVMLRRRGLPSTLSLGTRRHGDELKFHAWISADGVVLNVGGDPRHFAVLATFHDPAGRVPTNGKAP